MLRKHLTAAALSGAALLATAAPALAAGNGDAASRKAVFSPAIYAEGTAWGTNPNGDLPAPNDHNRHSYDDLFVFTNGADGQLPVAEAAPGTPGYNAGRWAVRMVTWAPSSTPTVLTDNDQVEMYLASGSLSVTETDNYFSCPLLPVK